MVKKKDDFYDLHLSDIPIFNYMGVLNPNDVIPTLQNYDALIFPSHYDGEGCPGILVEALLAGVPIIASKWKYSGEFVCDGVNGYLCDTYDAESYAKAIVNLLIDDSLQIIMSRHAHYMGMPYTATNAASLLRYYCN